MKSKENKWFHKVNKTVSYEGSYLRGKLFNAEPLLDVKVLDKIKSAKKCLADISILLYPHKQDVNIKNYLNSITDTSILLTELSEVVE